MMSLIWNHTLLLNAAMSVTLILYLSNTSLMALMMTQRVIGMKTVKTVRMLLLRFYRNIWRKKMNKLLKAALSYYQAQKDEAIAVLEVYFESSVGIGEHSNLLKEITEWTQKLTEAEDNIRTLEQKFVNKSS